MRSIVTAIACCLVNLAIGEAHGQSAAEPVQPTKPKVYALVAAMGDRFSFVYQAPRTKVDFYRRSSVAAPDNLLNHLALQSLDKAVARIDPESTRIYMTLAAAPVEGVAPAMRESVAIGRVVAELDKMPQRLEWDRIVVAMPAYAAFELDAMASKLQGFGVYMQPLVGASFTFNNNQIDSAVHGREEVSSPDNKIVRSGTYVAPYSYIEIWVLDPKTLAVLDKQKRFDNEKIADPTSGSLDLSQIVSKKFLATRMVTLIEDSIGEAVIHSEINSRHGEVEVSEPKVVNPDDARK